MLLVWAQHNPVTSTGMKATDADDALGVEALPEDAEALLHLQTLCQMDVHDDGTEEAMWRARYLELKQRYKAVCHQLHLEDRINWKQALRDLDEQQGLRPDAGIVAVSTETRLWYWCGNDQQYRLYLPLHQSRLQHAHANQLQTCVLDSDVQGRQYVIDFAKQTQTSKRTGRERPIVCKIATVSCFRIEPGYTRIPHMLPPAVQHCTQRARHLTHYDRAYELIDLDVQLLEFQYLAHWFLFPFPPQAGVSLERIARISHPVSALWYETQKSVQQDRSEAWLFHGTRDSDLAAVLAQGLDVRCAHANNYFGTAIYGTTDPVYVSSMYCCPDADGLCHMLVVKCLVGRSCIKCVQTERDTSVRRPPAGYDSIQYAVSRQTMIYALYNNAQCYITHCISFRRPNKM